MYLRTHAEADFSVPAAKVWPVLNNFGQHYQFDPFIEISPITNGIPSGLGAERKVIFYDGTCIRQTILDIVEGESLLIGFTETDLPIKNGTAKFTLVPSDRSFCRVSVEIIYEPKYGVIGGVAGLLFAPTMRIRNNMMLLSLKRFVTNDHSLQVRLP
jgi:hypothetical protein